MNSLISSVRALAGDAASSWLENVNERYNASLNHYLVLLREGRIQYPAVKAGDLDGQGMKEFVERMAKNKMLFLHGGRQGRSVVHSPPAKYGQMIPSTLIQPKENV